MQHGRMDNNDVSKHQSSEESNRANNESASPKPGNLTPASSHPWLSWKTKSLQNPHGRSESIFGVDHRSENIPPRSIRKESENMANMAPQSSTAGPIERTVPRKAYKERGKETFDKSRAPLKKRPTTPMPPPPRQLSTQTSTTHRFIPFHSAPFLRQTSSTFSIYKNHDMVPPQLCLTSSRAGQQLISEPLLDTPKPGNLLWPQTPSTIATMFSASTPSFGDFTPGVDMFAKQVMHEHPVILNTSSNRQNVPTPTVAQAKVPPKNISLPSASQVEYATPSTQFGFRYHVFPAAPRPVVIPDRSNIHSQVLPTKTREGTYQFPPHYPGNVKTDLFNNVPFTNRPCKCIYSRCLKLYCECFHYGSFCDEKLCRCKGCFNNEAHNEPRGDRVIAIKKIIARRPDAFRVKVKKRKGKGCGCRKSGCLKKYCDCVALGRACSTSCKCSDCQNVAEPFPAVSNAESSAVDTADIIETVGNAN